MKRQFILLFLCFITAASFAQKFGVDLGHAFSINRFKNITPRYDPYMYVISDEKQNLFPNASFRPYFRIYKKIYVSFGVDLCKYKFRQSVYDTDISGHNYSGRLVISEFHTPLMIRAEIHRFKQSHPLSVYGGIFARFLNRTQGNSLWHKANFDSIPEKDLHMDINIRNESFNLLVGLHQAFYLKKFTQLYADLQLKYISGYIDAELGSFPIHSLPMKVENKLAISLGFGISFLKPDKGEVSHVDPTRLED
ncbi:MAG: hypothetical protein K0S33_1154 [Bacteroidetes bacterium]|jgi:hypothetical protein|nr:hypothetical protein [Bacteroidota bacterium]